MLEIFNEKELQLSVAIVKYIDWLQKHAGIHDPRKCAKVTHTLSYVMMSRRKMTGNFFSPLS